jgi:ribose 5-phosphate isomerase A
MKWEQSEPMTWGSEILNYEQKLESANKIATMVNSNDVIGFGSGSTSFLAVHAIASRLKKGGISIHAIPTSHEISMLCASLNIPTTTLYHAKPDWCFDGTDEIDKSGNLIKGRGGAMFNEKLVMRCCSKRYILAEKSKIVEKLGKSFPIPVETYPKAIYYVKSQLFSIGANSIDLRMAKGKDGPIITENSNIILDCYFENISASLESEIKNITGVVESGLFWGYGVELI